MKTQTLLMLVVLLLFSCRKEKNVIPENKLMTAKMNGIEWRAHSHSSITRGRLSVSGGVYDKDDILREWFVFGSLPLQVGLLTYQDISNDSLLSASYSTTAADGDVIKDYYRIDKNAETNFISIDKLDTINNIVEGRFDITLRVDVTTTDSAPGVIHFTAGRFKSELSL